MKINFGVLFVWQFLTKGGRIEIIYTGPLSTCVICNEEKTYQDYVVYDGLTGLCKCRSCMATCSNSFEFKTRPEVLVVFDKKAYFKHLALLGLENLRAKELARKKA